MKILKNRQPLVHKKLFGIILMCGFMIGIIYANVIGKNYMDSSGILSDYFLSRYKYYDIDNSNLFFYLLKERIVPYIFLWIAGITVIGAPVVWLYLAWIGFSGGMLISMSVMKFGFKGLVLCVGGILPQYLIYIPATLIFLQQIYSFTLLLYGSSKTVEVPRQAKSRKQLYPGYIWSFILLLACMVIGILMESYVNPYILQ